MEYFLQEKYKEDKNFKRYLDDNSSFIKYLNRNPEYYKEFMRNMKEQYKERTSDKISDAMNTIEIVSSILDTLK